MSRGPTAALEQQDVARIEALLTRILMELQKLTAQAPQLGGPDGR